MKISEAITVLQNALTEFGDLQVVHADILEDVGFIIEFDQEFSVLGIPTEAGTEEKVMALTAPVLFLDENVLPGQPSPEKKSKFTVVK